MATHCSILAWRIPWTEEPGGLQTIVSQRIRHNNIRNMDDFKLQEGTFWNSDVVFWKFPSTSTGPAAAEEGAWRCQTRSPLTGLGLSPPSPVNTPQPCGPLPGVPRPGAKVMAT